MAVRAGNGVEAVNTYTAVSVSVDELVPNAVPPIVRQSLTLPSIATATQPACTLTGSGYAQEGLPSLSQNGQVLMFGCYNLTAGSHNAYQNSSSRMIARIYSDFTFDLDVYFTDGYLNNVFSSVVSVDGVSSFWTAGSQFMSTNAASPSPAPEGTTGGIRYLGEISVATLVLLSDTFPSRFAG
jgi:hypothetical protein